MTSYLGQATGDARVNDKGSAQVRVKPNTPQENMKPDGHVMLYANAGTPFFAPLLKVKNGDTVEVKLNGIYHNFVKIVPSSPAPSTTVNNSYSNGNGNGNQPKSKVYTPLTSELVGTWVAIGKDYLAVQHALYMAAKELFPAGTPEAVLSDAMGRSMMYLKGIVVDGITIFKDKTGDYLSLFADKPFVNTLVVENIATITGLTKKVVQATLKRFDISTDEIVESAELWIQLLNIVQDFNTAVSSGTDKDEAESIVRTTYGLVAEED